MTNKINILKLCMLPWLLGLFFCFMAKFMPELPRFWDFIDKYIFFKCGNQSRWLTMTVSYQRDDKNIKKWKDIFTTILFWLLVLGFIEYWSVAFVFSHVNSFISLLWSHFFMLCLHLCVRHSLIGLNSKQGVSLKSGLSCQWHMGIIPRCICIFPEK